MSEVTTNPENIEETGHPKGLMTLFFSEMWERFCYYGMRTLLTLYLIKSLMKGDAEASLIYGAYTGLVYAAPVLGGKMADRFLGYRYAIILGAVLMAIGEFLILGGTDQFLLVGMGAIIIGNGYFKANISTIVGKLYKDGDPRRDSGFTIFYIGINVGALLATTVVAYIGETYGFKYGFGLAGIGMLLGLVIFYVGRANYAASPGLDFLEAGKKKVLGPLNVIHIITIVSVLLIPVCYLLIANNEVLNFLFLGLFIYVAYSLISAGAKAGPQWRDRMIALVIFMVINIVFWACFEQAGTSLTLFADRNVNREILGWTMPASMTQFFNPFFIIVFGSIFSVMWVKLSKIGRNPSIPMKFALGIFQLGLGFLVTIVGLQMQTEYMVPLLTLVFLYLLHTTGELFISPIGLSMVTKLAPKNIAGTAMGGWFLSFAIANLLGGQIAALTGEGHGGGASDDTKFTVETTVKDALEMMDGTSIKFEDWKPLIEDEAVNITLGYYMDIEDWVGFREQQDNGTFADWKNTRIANDTLTDAKEWLDVSKWTSLGERYKSIAAADKKVTEEAEKNGTLDQLALVDIKAWKYFRPHFDELKETDSTLSAAFGIQKMAVLEKGLNKYVDIFSIIGYILLGFALLIVVLKNPLNRLMHGVV
jgi:proton-dependent oligopeptide transporter, POT family